MADLLLSAQAYSVTPLSDPWPPAPAQEFSGMSAHRSAPAHPVFAHSAPFPLRSALTCAGANHF